MQYIKKKKTKNSTYFSSWDSCHIMKNFRVNITQELYKYYREAEFRPVTNSLTVSSSTPSWDVLGKRTPHDLISFVPAINV